jgi:hypothetical protein
MNRLALNGEPHRPIQQKYSENVARPIQRVKHAVGSWRRTGGREVRSNSRRDASEQQSSAAPDAAVQGELLHLSIA